MGEQPTFDFGDRPKYHIVDAGGVWEHKSGDCDRHGVNVPFFRVYKASGPYYCVACALEVSEVREVSPAGVAYGSKEHVRRILKLGLKEMRAPDFDYGPHEMLEHKMDRFERILEDLIEVLK